MKFIPLNKIVSKEVADQNPGQGFIGYGRLETADGIRAQGYASKLVQDARSAGREVRAKFISEGEHYTVNGRHWTADRSGVVYTADAAEFDLIPRAPRKSSGLTLDERLTFGDDFDGFEGFADAENTDAEDTDDGNTDVE